MSVFDPVAFIAAVQSSVELLRVSSNNPADQVRLLSAVYTSMLAHNDPIGALIRQSLLSSIALAVAGYGLSSRQQATDLLDSLLPLYDGEIALTSDYYAFEALRLLKASVSNDLQTRGLLLPELVTVIRKSSLPSFVIAFQLYQDCTRADEVTLENDVRHPLFFPSTFAALSS